MLGIYRETVNAYNAGMHILCTAGLRSLVEGICADQGVKDGPLPLIRKQDGSKSSLRRSNKLEGMIYGMLEKGFLTKVQAESLHEHRFMGNDALHKLDTPSALALRLSIEMIEHILETLYEFYRTKISSVMASSV